MIDGPLYGSPDIVIIDVGGVLADVPVDSLPTLAELKAWLGLAANDTTDDVVLQQSLDSSLIAQDQLCFYPWSPTDPTIAVMTEDLRQAIYLRSQRLAARRNSPEGIVGFAGSGGDFVASRVPAFDNDVVRLEGPYYKIPVA